MKTTNRLEHDVFIYPSEHNRENRYYFRAIIDADNVEMPENVKLLFEEFTRKIEEVLNEVR